jgi:signal transduction histidine kinase
MNQKRIATESASTPQSYNGHATDGQNRPEEAAAFAVNEAVLIIADEAEFARSVVGRWQMERIVPAFTLMSSDLCQSANFFVHGIAILGPRVRCREAVLTVLEDFAVPVLVVAADGDASQLRSLRPRALVLRQTDGWLDILIQMAGEILRRAEAQRYLQHAEQMVAASQRHATLGRYMLEMRHGLNNCLTSVLGNAELLLLEPGMLSAEARDQVHTIHTMAMRMHEVLQRFSSLESEMQFAEKGSHSETARVSQSPVSGV